MRQAAAAFNRMQERIRRFLAQRTEMLAGVSHDLRTPLTRLRLALAMLPRTEELSQDVVGDDRRRGGDGAHDRRLSRLRPRRGRRSRPKRSIWRRFWTTSRRARGAPGRCWSLDVPADLTMKLRADAVRRAVTNLVDNARRHARHVELAAVTQGRSVLVTVDDDGPGIPADRRESVFRPFESGSSGGTGLGLTIARDIVRAHGGEIVLEDSPRGGLRAEDSVAGLRPTPSPSLSTVASSGHRRAPCPLTRCPEQYAERTRSQSHCQRAPEQDTRRTPHHARAPTRAATPPRSARKARDVTATRGINCASGTTIAVSSGSRGAEVKLPPKPGQPTADAP